MVQISAQMKFGQQGRRFLRQPDLEFDRVGRPVELEEAGRADELCAAGAAGQLDRPGAGRRLVVGVERGRPAGEARERFVFAAGTEPGFGAFEKGRAVRDGTGTAELVRHLFFGRRAGLEVDDDRCRRGRRREQQQEQRRHTPRIAIRIAALDMLRRLGTGGPRVSTARVPIRSPWTVGLGSIRDRRPEALGDPLDRRAEPPEVGGPAHVELARRLLLRAGGLDVAADQHLLASVPPPASRRTPRRPPGRSGRARPRPAPPGCRRPGARSLAASRGGEL